MLPDPKPVKYIRADLVGPVVEKTEKETAVFTPDKSFKYDQGKLQYSLVPVLFLEKVAELMTKGALKYVRDNWRISGFQYSRAEDALWRHFQSWRNGEDLDEETGCHHMAAVAFYAACIIEYHYSGQAERQRLDDRFARKQNALQIGE